MHPLLRKFIGWLLITEKQYIAKIKKSGWLHRVTHTDLFSFTQPALSRGLAIGLFWACIPIPFQMVPALLFCWLGFANLPIAILCVWISNPFTYVPIFYLEYNIGLLFHLDDNKITAIPWKQFSDQFIPIFERITGGDDKTSLRTVLSKSGDYFLTLYLITVKGSLLLGTALAIIGYTVGFPLSRKLMAHRRRNKTEQP